MGIKTVIATIGSINNTDLKDALLPVLTLCSKKDENPPYLEALIVDIGGESIDFWTTNNRNIFVSTVAAEGVKRSMSAVVRPSRFGLMVEHIRKAKHHLCISIAHDEEGNAIELTIGSENGVITIGDSLAFKRPRKQPVFDAFDRDTEHTFVPGQVIFLPKTLLPIMNAFKNVTHIDIAYSPANMQMRIKTQDTASVKFDAIVAGCEPPRGTVGGGA